MTRPTKKQSADLSAAIRAAVTDGARTPQEIRDYMVSNGYKGEIPSRVTLEAHMRHNGLIYIAGRWEKPE